MAKFVDEYLKSVPGSKSRLPVATHDSLISDCGGCSVAGAA